jgi:hypothetical protein
MKQVVLIFPDHLSIADYVLSQKVRNAEVNSDEQTVTATLTEMDIKVATETYGAILKVETPKN